eukprot:augustus_masked-scaffold_8-processed-gene-3.13-mRNA-1 protein AED:1.00 eAED:1.00 QI:0/-1/0/0/-1/1/1/0/606
MYESKILVCIALVLQQFNCISGISPLEHHVSTSVNFRVPKSWRINSEAGLNHADALFGVPFLKDRTITGPVYFMTPNFNQSLDSGADPTSQKLLNGCQDYDVVLSEKELGTKKIFLVDRGGCSFAEKASVAQSNGAAAIIVVNNECISSDVVALRDTLGLPLHTLKHLCCANTMTNAVFGCDLSNTAEILPFMTTTSSTVAQNILVPAILVSVFDGLRLKYCLCHIRKEVDGTSGCKYLENLVNGLEKKQQAFFQCGKDIIMDIQLDTPHETGRVKYELWMRPEAPPSFLRQFQWFAESITNHAEFMPRYMVHQPIGCASGDIETDDVCKHYCLKVDDEEGQIVCYLPDNSVDNGYDDSLTGVDLLREIVRQQCIIEQDMKDQAKYKKVGVPNWWKYQTLFMKKGCISSKNGLLLEECSNNAAQSIAKVDFKEWTRCSKKGGTEEKDVLRELNKMQVEKGIFATAMIVNSRVMHFGLAADSLAQRVCDGFADHTIPEVCKCVAKATTEDEFMRCERCVRKNNCAAVDPKAIAGGTGVESGGFVIEGKLFFISLVGLTVGGALYLRREKRRMKSDMRDILAEYMPLDDMDYGADIGGSSGQEHTTLI